ncbi:MAG: hypothetical protein CVU11_17015, partial [Bacteroidetes bacterium HGW-Bacteroidetes-6]
MATFEVGMGTPITGIFSGIDWSNSPYFLKIENDPKGGTNYSMTGISEILSVPYAMHAKTAETLSGNISDLYPTIWNTNGNRIYYNNGNVGIGINKPTRTLHINKGYDAFPILVHSPTGSAGIEINTPVNTSSGGILYSFESTPIWY